MLRIALRVRLHSVPLRMTHRGIVLQYFIVFNTSSVSLRSTPSPTGEGYRNRYFQPQIGVNQEPKETTIIASSDCQSKCNTFFKKSLGDKKPRHLRGRLLIKETTASNCSCVTLLKSVPRGKKNRTNPFMFSLLPRCQGE